MSTRPRLPYNGDGPVPEDQRDLYYADPRQNVTLHGMQVQGLNHEQAGAQLEEKMNQMRAGDWDSVVGPEQAALLNEDDKQRMVEEYESTIEAHAGMGQDEWEQGIDPSMLNQSDLSRGLLGMQVRGMGYEQATADLSAQIEAMRAGDFTAINGPNGAELSPEEMEQMIAEHEQMLDELQSMTPEEWERAVEEHQRTIEEEHTYSRW